MSLYIFSSSRTRLCFFLSILLVCLSATFLKVEREPLDPSNLELDKFWLDKTFAPQSYELVMLGDSRLYRGISAEEVSSVTGLKTLNLGYSRGGFSKEFIDHGLSKLAPASANKTMVFSITPLSLTPVALNNEQLREYLDVSFIKRYLLNNFPSILENLRARTIDGLREDKSDISYFQEINPNGWIASSKKEISNKSGIEEYSKVFIDNKVSSTAENILLEKVRELTSSGIKVYGFRPPSSKVVEKIENEQSGFSEEKFSKNFSKAGGLWLNFERSKYKSYDGSHLVKESAVSFSRELANSIKRGL